MHAGVSSQIEKNNFCTTASGWDRRSTSSHSALAGIIEWNEAPEGATSKYIRPFFNFNKIRTTEIWLCIFFPILSLCFCSYRSVLHHFRIRLGTFALFRSLSIASSASARAHFMFNIGRTDKKMSVHKSSDEVRISAIIYNYHHAVPYKKTFTHRWYFITTGHSGLFRDKL